MIGSASEEGMWLPLHMIRRIMEKKIKETKIKRTILKMKFKDIAEDLAESEFDHSEFPKPIAIKLPHAIDPHFLDLEDEIEFIFEEKTESEDESDD